MQTERDLLKKEMTIIAYAGADAANSKLPPVINDYLATNNIKAHLIGIAINEDDFKFFISNLKKSKVEVTVFAEEFQKKAADFYNLNGFLIAAFKKEEDFILVEEREMLMMDDKKIIQIINKIVKERDAGI